MALKSNKMAHSLMLAKRKYFKLINASKIDKKIYEAWDYIFPKLTKKYLIATFNLPRPSIGSPRMLSMNKI